MRKKRLKVLILTTIVLLGIGFSTTVNAAMEFFKGELPIVAHHLVPFPDNFTCIEANGRLKPTLTRETLGNYSVGQKVSTWCSACDSAPSKPWSGVLTTAYYEVGASIDYNTHQDAAYIIAESAEKGALLSTDLRDAMWSTDLNIGSAVSANRLGQEAAAYKEFYARIHSGTTDIFMSFVQDNTNVDSVKVGVNQKEGSYTVGPFKIQYPEGKFGDKNFSYINKIEAVTDTGTLPVEVLNISGNTDKNGGTIHTPKSNEEFYIKFYTTSATKVSMKATFTYLEHCEASMSQVNGKYMNWEWKQVEDGTHNHPYEVPTYTTYHGPCGREDCNLSVTHTHQTGTTTRDDYKQKYAYKLTKTEGGKIQLLLKYAGGSKIWKENQYIIGSGIDLTMDIAGYVFLDQDNGKVNEGNNILDGGEALSGVEVMLYDASGNAVSAGGKFAHVHKGDRVHGGDCYSEPIYHTHGESCYVYNHTHIGNSVQGGKGTCYETPVYHTHDYTCEDSAGRLICGKTTSDVEYYALSCTKEITKTLLCGKDSTSIDHYKLTCKITEGDSYSYSCIRLTDSNGHYEFTKLNAMKKYYVKFTYNGMLYTNVEYNVGGGNNASKSTEEGQEHTTNRQTFNNKFAEIGSYPQNYKIVNKMFDNQLGDYNKVYLQEEIADIFKELSKAVVENEGDLKKASSIVASKYGGDEETKRKVQYAADCRISAYSVKQYPTISIFAVEKTGFSVGNTTFPAIYEGNESQLHVNLGIKSRPTFDLALYKDVFNATLNINGKEEVYTYDARKDWQNNGFSVGVREEDYLNQLREKYVSGKATDLTTKEVASEGEYNHEYRTEEIINGNNQNVAMNESNLYDENKNYAWRDINHGLSDNDKLQIHVTYKIAIRNQSNVVGSVTEIVDYYDSNYQFEKAYIGDKNGNEIAGTKVEANETSMYGEATRISAANGQWTVASEKRSYKTIYLRPTEKKLYADDKEQYIYVTFGLINPEQTLINAGLPNGEKLYTYNLAEINGYKTYGTNIEDVNSLGLVDRDSNSGNFNPSTYEMGKTALEDDESKAPAYVYSHRSSRTLEGTVFEDGLSKDATASKEKHVVNVAKTRFGNGMIEDSKTDKRIQGVKVELVEIKDGKLIARQTTYTDENGWYGFGAFLPGNYTIRFTYGSEDKTALTTTSQYTQGLNDTSYNGQDYESTIFTTKQAETITPHNYKVDETLNGIYTANNQAKNSEETIVNVEDQVIIKYERDGYYWFDDVTIANKSDATDNALRRSQVNAYSKSEYGKEITNHKAEVFNSYINQSALRKAESKDKNFDEFTQAHPMDEAVDTKEKNRELVNELERRTYMYAYTPEIPVEVEYTTKQIAGNLPTDTYAYKITGIDFGVVERPRSELTIDQDVKHIKVTAADGTVLFDTESGVDNLQWVAKGDITKYDKNELINIILDDELLSGSKLEVVYNITVTNNSEANIGTARAKTIINYVANNLNFDLSDNNGLWEVAKKEDIQTTSHSTFINNASKNKDVKVVDLSTQTIVLKATNTNPLTKVLNPGESTTSTLTLKKTLSAESSSDDLSYSNMSEIVEIDNTVGRYDHGAIPGNQSPEEQPREHDTSGASRYDEINKKYSPDGKIIVTPPTGSKMIYYVLGITVTVILAAGIILIKKFVIRKK